MTPYTLAYSLTKAPEKRTSQRERKEMGREPNKRDIKNKYWKLKIQKKKKDNGCEKGTKALVVNAALPATEIFPHRSEGKAVMDGGSDTAGSLTRSWRLSVTAAVLNLGAGAH